MPQPAIPTIHATDIAHQPLEAIAARVEQNAPKVAALGAWPAHISVSSSLTARVPVAGQKRSGFDAGLATSLGLIPAHAQPLLAGLHAAYTPALVTQVRAEIEQQPLNSGTTWQVKNAESATCWWLAACSLCIEGDEVDEKTFRQQLLDFQKLIDDPATRQTAATNMLREMTQSFDTKNGYACGTVDGAIQGAYIAGHSFGVLHHQSHGLYFIGTYLPSLGLENFAWDQGTDDQGRATSGAVHGSRQFVKCASKAEMERAVHQVQESLRAKPAPHSPKP